MLVKQLKLLVVYSVGSGEKRDAMLLEDVDKGLVQRTSARLRWHERSEVHRVVPTT